MEGPPGPARGVRNRCCFHSPTRWCYLAFTGFVLVMLTVDLGIFHRKAHEVSARVKILHKGYLITKRLV